MEHLSLEVFDLTGTGSKYAVLPKDASITIIDTSELFASGDVWSYPFTLNTEANVHIFGTSGEMHGSRLHEQIDRRRARLWVEGLPLYLGYLRLDGEADVDEDGNVDVTFEGGQKTFEEMTEGARASQVPMLGDVPIGVALWRKRWVNLGLKLSASAVFKDGKTSESADVQSDSLPPHGHEGSLMFNADGENDGEAVQEYPRMVYPREEFKNVSTGRTEPINCVNTDYPYTEDEDGTPTYPYCNVALCYQKYGYEKKDQQGHVTNEYSGEPEAQRGYEVMPADRVNSAPNFFVIYWIRALMNHLGIYIEENQMMDVEDLRRLFFVNTKCAYKIPKHIRSNPDSGFNRYRFTDHPSRFAINRLVAEQINPEKIIKTSECAFACENLVQGAPQYEGILDPSEVPVIDHVVVKVNSVDKATPTDKNEYEERNGYLHDAFATSECFPDADIQEVIKAIESGFGVRFLFDGSYRRVRIVLLRNILRSEEVQEIKCDIIGESKTENNIRGFRMTYGNTDDTHFYYKGFNDMLPHKKELWPDNSDTHDYSQWNLNADYASIMQKVSAFDNTCYVTPDTGNAYGVKIDKDAKRYDELHPSLFEYAGFMDAEDGDCTGEEDTIETINVGFAPAIMNDLNMEEERSSGSRRQRFALFVDEQMRPRRPDLEDGTDYNDPEAAYDVDAMDKKCSNMKVDDIVKPGEFAITSDMYARASGLRATLKTTVMHWIGMGEFRQIPVTWDITMDVDGHINEGYRLYLQDNYEPNDDGVPPIETHDWGLTLGIMRGSGSDAYVNYEADPQDGEGNDTWEIVPGSSATAHPDICDSYGNEWDYNGTEYVDDAVTAIQQLTALFPDSNASFNDHRGYISEALVCYVTDNEGKRHKTLFATKYSGSGVRVARAILLHMYVPFLEGHTPEEIMEMDATGGTDLEISHLIVELDSSEERKDTLLQLCRMAYGGESGSTPIDNGVGSRFGRVSLKLRAEKPNPFFDPKQPETHYDPQNPGANTNPRYLRITDENLRGRGLCDKFYKEYSYLVRNSRIANREVNMELAQLLAIDKTKKAKVGDVTGFIRKMQYTVSNETGLGKTAMEILYI